MRDAIVFYERILEVLKVSEELRIHACERLRAEFLWFPIADHENSKASLEESDTSVDHTVPAHGHLFGYNASMFWKVDKHEPPRDLKIFGTDNADGIREDDLYELLGCKFDFTHEEIKSAIKHAKMWYHPDKSLFPSQGGDERGQLCISQRST